jgi:hypothetical protein
VKEEPRDAVLLAALLKLSGSRRCWVRTERVLAACAEGPPVRYWELLSRPDWRNLPELGNYLRLCALVRDAPTLIEGRGNFGTDDTAPSEPVFNRCRPGLATAAWLARRSP